MIKIETKKLSCGNYTVWKAYCEDGHDHGKTESEAIGNLIITLSLLPKYKNIISIKNNENELNF